MTREEWQKISAAAKLLGLDDKATLKEIKKAYRAASKKYHPDTAATKKSEDDAGTTMHEIVSAYELLQEYCKNYTYPLVPPENEDMEVEDWWMDRFGQDPLWGKK